MVKRRTKKKTRRSRLKGVSALGLAETYMLTNVATQTFFRTNPVTFLMGNQSTPFRGADGTAAISLFELLKTNQHSSGASQYDTTALIKKNFSQQWTSGLMSMVLIPIGFKMGRAIAKPAISRANRLLGKSGIGNTVKV